MCASSIVETGCSLPVSAYPPRTAPVARVGLRFPDAEERSTHRLRVDQRTLFNSAEVAYNVFETYRGAEAGYVYGRVLSMILPPSSARSAFRRRSRINSATHNAEGLENPELGGSTTSSGFGPVTRRSSGWSGKSWRACAAIRATVPRRRPSSASPPPTSSSTSTGERSDVMGRFSPGKVGLAVSRYLSRRSVPPPARQASTQRSSQRWVRSVACSTSVRALGSDGQ